MTTQIFFNGTTLNNKIQIMTSLELSGKGIKKYGINKIVNHHGNIYKNNFDYWITKSAFETLKSNYNLTRTCF
jgi:hypothetical protein